MKLTSTWIFVILTGYYHIGSQRGKVPMHVRARQPNSEGGVGGAGPSWMKMWSCPGPKVVECTILTIEHRMGEQIVSKYQILLSMYNLSVQSWIYIWPHTAQNTYVWLRQVIESLSNWMNERYVYVQQCSTCATKTAMASWCMHGMFNVKFHNIVQHPHINMFNIEIVWWHIKGPSMIVGITMRIISITSGFQGSKH